MLTRQQQSLVEGLRQEAEDLDDETISDLIEIHRSTNAKNREHLAGLEAQRASVQSAIELRSACEITLRAILIRRSAG